MYCYFVTTLIYYHSIGKHIDLDQGSVIRSSTKYVPQVVNKMEMGEAIYYVRPRHPIMMVLRLLLVKCIAATAITNYHCKHCFDFDSATEPSY